MLNLFFIDSIPDTSNFIIEGDEAHHAINVLRIKTGEEILISDGVGNWVRASVESIAKKKFEAKILERGKEIARKPKLTILQALPKSDRTKEAIELLVQAGVDEIIPWSAERSIAKAKSDTSDKWQVGAIAAAKQARRFHIPNLAPVSDLASFLSSRVGNFALLVLHESATTKLSAVVSSKMNELDEIIIVIGPEGGICGSELALFEEGGGLVVKMGEPVFRSAHAGAAALSAISALLGRW